MASDDLKPIILYDIPCGTPGRPWSPNTMKTRYCLGYKQLPFTTIWVEFPDIAGLLQSKGIVHPPYTLPAIEDLNTGAVVMDSGAIATYLDKTYPETPTVLSPAAEALLERLGNLFSFGSSRVVTGTAPYATANASQLGGDTENAKDHSPLAFLVLGCERLNPVSKAYYHQTRAARFGERWTILVRACSTNPEERKVCVGRGIEAIKEIMQKVTRLYDHQSHSGGEKSGEPFALGKEPCFLDFMVAGRIKFVLDGLTPSEAESLMVTDGKRLAQLIQDLEKYYKY